MKWSQILGYRVWGLGSREISHPISPNIENHTHTPYPIPHTLSPNRGFGILEVLVAAVVLGFLIVGLTQLQKGNREGILRVRARDAANFVAQHVLDSIASVGMKAMENNLNNCTDASKQSLIYCEKDYIYSFEGKPQLDKNTAGTKVEIKYNVEVSVLEDTKQPDTLQKSMLQTGEQIKSQSLEAVVSWQFKNATQSIKMAKVVR